MTGCKRNPGPVVLPVLGRKPDITEPGIPIDVSRANLFDTSYVHPILRRNDTILWEYYNIYIKVLLWLCSGTTAGMDQWVGEISPERHHPSKSNHLNHVRNSNRDFTDVFHSILQQVHESLSVHQPTLQTAAPWATSLALRSSVGFGADAHAGYGGAVCAPGTMAKTVPSVGSC